MPVSLILMVLTERPVTPSVAVPILPLQALTLLNDQAYVEMALGFAVSILEKTQGKSDKDRIIHAVRRALSRDPSAREIEVLLGLLNEQSERLKSDTSIAKSLLSQAPQIAALREIGL
jgi:hypothetical protein